MSASSNGMTVDNLEAEELPLSLKRRASNAFKRVKDSDSPLKSKKVEEAAGGVLAEESLPLDPTLLCSFQTLHYCKRSIAVTKSGKELFVGFGRFVKLWRQQGNVYVVENFCANKSELLSIILSCDEQSLFGIADDHTVHQWDITTKAHIASFNLPSSFSCLTFSKDQKNIFFGDFEGKVNCFNIETKVRTRFENDAHASPISHMLSVEKENKLVSAGWDGKIKIWDLSNQKCIDLAVLTSQVQCMTTSKDEKFVYISHLNNSIAVWNLESLELSRSIKLDSPAKKMLITKNNEKLILGYQNGEISIRQLGNEDNNTLLKGHSDCISALAISPDEKRLFTGSYDSSFKIWCLDTDKPKEKKTDQEINIKNDLVALTVKESVVSAYYFESNNFSSHKKLTIRLISKKKGTVLKVQLTNQNKF